MGVLTAATKSFHPVDYVVFILTIVISLGIGIYFALTGDRQKTTGEYLTGNRQLKVLPVAISMLVSFISAQGILGTPAEMYAFGAQFSMYIIAAILGCTYGAFLFLPVLYPLKVTSSFEYFEMRFNSKVTRLTGTFITLINSIFTTAIGLYAPSAALEAVTGFPVWVSMVLCDVSCTIYTCIGGMKAVIWTDVFQAVVIFFGMIVVVIMGLVKVGGFSEMWKYNDEWGRLEFLNFDPDPRVRTTFWTVVVMMSILFMCLTTAQPAVQRYCSLPTMREARISVLLNMPGFVISGVLNCLAGVVIFAYYAKVGCDPITAKFIHSPNQILPYFVLDVIGIPGITGLFVACLYSGSLSTVSSTLNSMAAITWEDILKLKFNHLQEERKALIAKILVAVYGAIGLGTGFAVQLLGGTFIQIAFTVMGSTLGPIIGLFFLAAIFPRAGTRGAMIGVVIGLCISLWMAAGSTASGIQMMPLPMPSENCFSTNGTEPNVTVTQDPAQVAKMERMQRFTRREFIGLENVYAVSYLWYPFIGMFIVLIIGFITSFIPGLHHEGRVSRKYLFTFIRPFAHACQPPGAPDGSDEEDDWEEKGPLKQNGFSNGDIYSPKEIEALTQRKSVEIIQQVETSM